MSRIIKPIGPIVAWAKVEIDNKGMLQISGAKTTMSSFAPGALKNMNPIECCVLFSQAVAGTLAQSQVPQSRPVPVDNPGSEKEITSNGKEDSQN